MNRIILDCVYMVVRREPPSVIYAAPGGSAKEAWDNVMYMASKPTLWDRRYLRKKGYRALGVTISLAYAEPEERDKYPR